MKDLIHKEEVYKIIGICMDVHRQLGKGFLEIVYKDAIEYECKQKDYCYEREKEFLINYKYIILPHKFYADFVLFDKIILEVKCCSGFADEFIAQTLNYLAASKLRVGLIVNFGKDSLEYKRIVL
jgi:GxxExxY protein